MSGVMRTQADGIVLPPAPRAQIWDEDVLPHWRRWAKLRTQLYPYLAAADAEYRRSGLPIMRHLALAYPDDPSATAVEDAFLFGPDLLAAPVLDQGATRAIGVPAARRLGGPVALGRATASRTAGCRSDGRACSPAAASVTLPAPLGELPLLARAGTLLSLLPPDVDTLAVVRRRARRSPRSPRAPASACCSRSRAARRPRGSRTAASCARRRAGGKWRLSVKRPLPRALGPPGVARDAPSSVPPVRRAAGRAPGLMELRRRHGRPLGELRRTPRRARGTHVRKRTHAWPPRRLTGSSAANRRTRKGGTNMSDGQHPRTSRPSPGLGAAPGALLVSLMADPEQQRRNARAGRRRFFRRHRP